MTEFVDIATLRKFYPVIQTKFSDVARDNQPWLAQVSDGGRPVLVTSDGKRGIFLSDPQDGTLMAFLYAVTERGFLSKSHRCSLVGVTVRHDMAGGYVARGSMAGLVPIQDYSELESPRVRVAVDNQLHAYINELAARVEHIVLCVACGSRNRVALDRENPCCGNCRASLRFGG